ncbi:MAG: TerC family protein [Acidobacteriota bacterium]
MGVRLFPFEDYWWFYLAFTGFVMLLLALDLGVFHRQARRVSLREASIWSAVWVVLALSCNYLFYEYALWKFSGDPRLNAVPGFVAGEAARQVGLEFLTGYLIEKALSVDNIFVFVLVFSFFAIPARYQHRVLFFGIIGALVFRAIFIGIGAALIQYHWVVLLFGVFLILTGIKMLVVPDTGINPEKNPIIRWFRRVVPVTPELHGQKFLVRLAGRVHATPLFVALLFVELSDIVFAVDSVPAIFAVTREPLIVFTTNVLAILGLRALYFVLAGAVEKFYLLKYALALVLIFVGVKMAWLNEWFGGKFPIEWSLAIIGALVGGAVALSLMFPKRLTGESV